MTDHVLCDLDDIADGGSAAFTIDRTVIMAIRRGGDVFGYVNSCPHIGSPLDFTPGKFLTADGAFILCSTHGALFRIADGHCVSGPCAGETLNPVYIAVHKNQVIATL
ncbi:MAG: Rieske 2Fe-2S domain-containing protein [Rhodospirillaceae bacterium]